MKYKGYCIAIKAIHQAYKLGVFLFAQIYLYERRMVSPK